MFPLLKMIFPALCQSCNLEIQLGCIFPISLHFPSIAPQFSGSHTGSCSTAGSAMKSLDVKALETKEQVP